MVNPYSDARTPADQTLSEAQLHIVPPQSRCCCRYTFISLPLDNSEAFWTVGRKLASVDMQLICYSRHRRSSSRFEISDGYVESLFGRAPSERCVYGIDEGIANSGHII